MPGSVCGPVWSVKRLYSDLVKFCGRDGFAFPIGLAVSGGADSMALAAQCLETSASYPSVRFQAFVVDHGARDGSTLEAEQVAKILQTRGLATRVLQIKWPSRCRPMELENFETLARAQRYQILGKACRDLHIKYLCVAHHGDDVAETAMLRIIRGQRGLGLAGIVGQANIPECFGLHGIHQSGDLPDTANDFGPSDDRRPAPVSYPNKSKHFTFHKGEARHSISLEETHRGRLPVEDQYVQAKAKTSSMMSERGGIQIIRPCLHLKKEALYTTCIQLQMPFLEDRSNDDPTITTRNAIRHVFKHSTLPSALQPSSMSRAAFASRALASTLSLQARIFITRIQNLNFCAESGRLRVSFPQYSNPHVKGGSYASAIDTRAIARALQLLFECVSPTDHVPIRKVWLAMKAMLPDFLPNEHVQGDVPKIKSFTIAGITGTQHRRTTSRPTALSSQRNPSATYEEFSDTCQEYEWQFSRQPLPNPSHTPGVPTLEYGPNTRADHLHGPRLPVPTPEWQLWDGRYWLKIHNRSSNSLKIRPYSESDNKNFISSLPTSERQKLRRLFHKHAPNKIKWTLPAIVLLSAGAERVLALPTFGVESPDCPCIVGYAIRYKQIDSVILAAATAMPLQVDALGEAV